MACVRRGWGAREVLDETPQGLYRAQFRDVVVVWWAKGSVGPMARASWRRDGGNIGQWLGTRMAQASALHAAGKGIGHYCRKGL